MNNSVSVQALENLHLQLEDASKQLSRLPSIPKSIDIYIEYIILGDRDNQELFEMFCELKGLDLLRSLYRLYPLEILNGMSLLFVNVNRPACLMYILSHPLMLELVEDSDPSHIEYYISMIKSLSLRLDSSKVALLFNQKLCRFPLAWESSRFYNHPEMLVRASTISIILGLMKSSRLGKIVSDPPLVEYFNSFPFNLYYLNLACSINYRGRQIDRLIEKGDSGQVASMLEDVKDIAMVLSDMMDLAHPQINALVTNAIIVYIIKPLLGSFTQSEKGTFTINLALFLLLEFANIFKEYTDILQFICLSMFQIKIDSGLLAKIKENSYVPLNFNESFENKRWIDKFENEINHYCKRVFNQNSSDFQPNSEFREEIQRLKQTVGIDLLTGERSEGFWFDNYQMGNNQVLNPIRQVVLSFLKTKDDKMLQLITKVIILFATDNQINPDYLLKCGLLLPTVNPEKFKDTLNIESLQFLIDTFLSLTLSELPFSTETLNTIFWFLDEAFTKQAIIGQKINEITLLLSCFQKSVIDLRNAVKSKCGGHLVSQLQESFKYPIKRYHSVSPNLLISNSDFIQEGETQQLLITFNCLLGLRYKYVRYSKFKLGYMNLPGRYAAKFENTSSQWRVGTAIELHKAMIQCTRRPDGQTYMIVRDQQRFVLVKETGRENEAMIVTNRKLKNTEWREVDNSDTVMQVLDDDRQLLIELDFQNEYMLKSTLERLRHQKDVTVKEELKFLNAYLLECISDIKKQ